MAESGPDWHSGFFYFSSLPLLSNRFTFREKDATFRSTHFTVKYFKEHAFDGSFLETGHIAPLDVSSIALFLETFSFGQ